MYCSEDCNKYFSFVVVKLTFLVFAVVFSAFLVRAKSYRVELAAILTGSKPKAVRDEMHFEMPQKSSQFQCIRRQLPSYECGKTFGALSDHLWR